MKGGEGEEERRGEGGREGGGGVMEGGECRSEESERKF